MLRIERFHTGTDTVLRAAGRLTGPWVAELSRALATEAGRGRILLDLTDVSFADANGLAFLHGLMGGTQVVLQCSPFLTEQLSTTGKVTS
jgi:hypothetical protein